MILSNDGFNAFHYRSYGTFFLHKIGSIISIGDLPTTNIIEPKKVACGLPFVLENADECLHPEASQDDGNPAEGTKKNGFTTGLNHSNEVGFETDSAHGHDDEEFR